jgi:hypothetical protein
MQAILMLQPRAADVLASTAPGQLFTAGTCPIHDDEDWGLTGTNVYVLSPEQHVTVAPVLERGAGRGTFGKAGAG